MTRRELHLLAVFAVFVATLCVTPLTGSNYVVRLATAIAMSVALAQSWNFIGGYVGYPAFSTAAFFGLGAYGGALSQNYGVPIVGAWVVGTLVAGILAAALGAVILRLRGHYFAIGSFALVEVSRLIIASWTEFTGGGNGLNVPFIKGGPDVVANTFLYVMIGIMVIVVLITFYVDTSRFGFGLRCIRQNENAANMVGVNTTLYKIIAYVLSSCLCGTVGAAYASWVGYIDPPDAFDILLTVKVPMMTLLGGAGTVLGPVVGATAFTLLEEYSWANFLEYNRAILGVVIVILIFFLPGGLLKVDYRALWSRVVRSGEARVAEKAAE